MATNQDASTLLQEGIAATRRGDKTAAYDLLKQVIELDERNEQAWLWLSGVVDSREDMQACLKNVLQINPNNARAAAGLRWLQQQQVATPASSNQVTLAAPNSGSLSATFPCPNCGKLVAENSLSCPDCAFQFYARCPNCAEYVDTAAVPDPRGDHCPNCGTAINRMELGRASSAFLAQSGSSGPHSAAVGEDMTLLPIKDLVEPTDKPRRSRGRLVYQLFLLLVLLALVIFLLWAKDNLKLTGSASHTQVIPAIVLSGIAGNDHTTYVQHAASPPHKAGQHQFTARLADDAPLAPADAAVRPIHLAVPVQRGDD